MLPFHEAMQVYKAQLEKGAIQVAYRGLMDYMMGLRTHLKKRYPDYFTSGSIYSGYMDMTYFSFTPKSIKARSLKTGIVFVHPKFRFEVWLSGANRKVQARYWDWFREKGWTQLPLVADPKRVDALMEQVAVAEPDFRDLDTLTEQIEGSTLKFIEAIEGFIAQHESSH